MNRLAFRISLYMTLAATLILCLVSIYSYGIARNAILKGSNDDVRDLSLVVRNHIEGALKGAKKIPEIFAEMLEHRLSDLSPASNSWLIASPASDIHRLVKSVILQNEEIFGMCFAFEPGVFQSGRRLAAPYFHRSGSNIQFIFLPDSYDYFSSDWYVNPRKTLSSGWSEPFFDEGGGKVLMVTFSQPLFLTREGIRKFCGVVTIDVSLDWLNQTMAAARVLETGYAFLLSKGGIYITHPNPRMVMKKADNASWKSPDAKNVPNLIPMYPEGWRLGIVIPGEELYANLNSLMAGIIGYCLLGFLVLFLLVVVLSERLIAPLRALAASATELGKGNIDIEFPSEQSVEEIRLLADSLSLMRDNLKKHISDLIDMTRKQQKLDSDLAISGTIQMEMLRNNFSLFDSLPHVDFFAHLRPAKQVGGDLYDFLMIDDEHLFFAVGDVSGKGVPGSLFMAMTITLLRARARAVYTPFRGNSTSEILTSLNAELCKGNGSSMYVTFFLGKLNVRTGVLQYSNVGHPAPFLVTDGCPELLPGQHGLPVGIFEEGTYSFGEITLKSGQTLVLFTDGVTDANNKDGTFFGNTGLEKTLMTPFSDPETLIKRILTAVDTFASGVEQYDDITLEVLTFHLPQTPEIAP
ncbi:MAG: SpoIIE family protein phosphatase [Candidatus Ozemobacteraceae bacterium]